VGIWQLDESVGLILNLLKDRELYANTMVMFTADNGPEVNCENGRCDGTPSRPVGSMDIGGFMNYASGASGILRGRKRDVWEGGHRVPGIISFPNLVGEGNREVWDPVVTMDFLPTIMELLKVDRPETQRDWRIDGVSLVDLMKGEKLEDRGIGWWYYSGAPDVDKGYAYRFGKWKLVVGSESCNNDDCKKPTLYNLEENLGEFDDLSDIYPEVLKAIMANFSAFNASVANSREFESYC